MNLNIALKAWRLDPSRQVCILHTLAPNLLLLDEAAAGLNTVEVEEILALVRQLNQEGITLLVVEHVMKVMPSHL